MANFDPLAYAGKAIASTKRLGQAQFDPTDFSVTEQGVVSLTSTSALAGSSLTTTGDITATAGNLILSGAAKQIRIEGGAVTDFIGSATLVSGTVTIANTNIAAGDIILLSRSSANGSTTLGVLTYSINAGTSFTITSVILGTPASTQTADVSIVKYVIVRQL